MKMKYLITLLFLIIVNLSHAQMQFSSKEEALTWLKSTFEERFTKTAVYKLYTNEYGEEKYSPIETFFDYEIKDSVLVIYKSKYFNSLIGKSFYEQEWYLIPFDKIDEIEPSVESKFFSNISNLTLRSKYKRFKSGDNIPYFMKGFKNKSIYDEIVNNVNKIGNTHVTLFDGLTIPFNLIDGQTKNLNENLISAFKALNPNLKTDDVEPNEAFDTLKFANEKKKYTYSKLPNYNVFTSDSSLVDLSEYVKTNRHSKEKPTLLITWSYKWCKPCMQKIDSLLNLGTAAKYNLALVNRDSEEAKMKYPSLYIGFSDLIKELAIRSPSYNEDAFVLFDRNNQVDDIDNGTTPLFVWLDKNLNIVGVYSGYNIRVSSITKILDKIEAGIISSSQSKFVDDYLLPCEEDVAVGKFSTSSSPNSDIITLKAIEIGKESPWWEIDFFTNKNGKLFFQHLRGK